MKKVKALKILKGDKTKVPKSQKSTKWLKK